MDLGFEVQQLQNTLASMQIISDDGKNSILLNTNQLLVVKEFILSVLKVFPIEETKKKLLFMLVSAIQNKKTILKDNKYLHYLNIQILELLNGLLSLRSILKKATCLWQESVKDSFKKLWLPAKTDCSNDCNGSSIKPIQNSWFLTSLMSPQNKSLQKTYLPFFKSLHAPETKEETTVLRSRKIKLQLTSLQIKALKPHVDNYRFTKNKAISLMNELSSGGGYKKTEESDIWKRRANEDKNWKEENPKNLGSRYFMSDRDYRDINVKVESNSRTPWLLVTPVSIRRHASNTACENRRAMMTNLKKGNITHFTQKFISKKKKEWTLGGIEPRSVTILNKRQVRICPTLELGAFKTLEDLPDTAVNHECMLHFDGLYHYLIVPEDKKVTNDKTREMCISGDPGVRSFMTMYDPMNQMVYDIGNGAATKMHEQLLKLDKMISLNTKANCKTKKILKKKIPKTRKKIQNLQSELHWKLSNWLCKNYMEVVIPKFGSKEMSEKTTKRNITTKTVRNMMVLGHCKFLEKLKTKAQEFNTTITIVDEINTTKRCGNCSNLQNNVAGKKEWKCSSCHQIMLRDASASRNIYRKVLDFGQEWQDSASLTQATPSPLVNNS